MGVAPPSQRHNRQAGYSRSSLVEVTARVESLIRRGQVASPADIEAGRWIALVALLVVCEGLVFGVLAFVNTRRTRGEAAAPPAGEP